MTKRQFKKALCAILCLIQFGQFSLGGTAVLASPVKFTPASNGQDTELNGNVDLNNLGSITMPRGRVSFNGKNVTVTIIPEWMFDRMEIFTGQVIQSEARVKGNQGIVYGSIFFNGGDWLNKLDTTRQKDLIFCDKEVVSGKIDSVNKDSILITEDSGKSRTVAINNIKDIRSCYVFSFAIPVSALSALDQKNTVDGEAKLCKLSPTSKSIALQAMRKDPLLKGDGDISNSKLFMLGAAMTIIQFGQLAPFIAVPVGSGGTRNAANQSIFKANNPQLYLPR